MMEPSSAMRASQDPVLWEGRGGGGGEQREGVRGKREKLNERDRAELRGATTTKLLQVELQTGFSAFLPAWLLSSSKNNVCCVHFWWREQRGVSAWKDGSYNKDQVPQENTAISFNPTSRDDNTKW